MYKIMMQNGSAGLYTKVLETAESIGETTYSLPVEGCKLPFSLDLVSSYGRFLLTSAVLSIDIGKSTASYTGSVWTCFTQPY